MGELSPWHWLIVLFIIMLLFGAKRLPDLARSLGSSARELKKGLREDDEPDADEPTSKLESTASVAEASATRQPEEQLHDPRAGG
jgi:sec-independent protein translocase protein TatA